MMKRYLCPECGGHCKISFSGKKRICKQCNQYYDEKEVMVECNPRRSLEKSLDEERLSSLTNEWSSKGLRPGQIKQLLWQEKIVVKSVLSTMIMTGKGLQESKDYEREKKISVLLSDEAKDLNSNCPV